MSEPPKPRIRRSDDWVYRLRAWVWYAALKTRCYKSDDELDDLFVPGAKLRTSEARLRRFAGIRRSGHDPGVVHLKEGKKSLVDRVEADNLYRGTSDYYKSKLWKLLTPPALNLDEINALVVELTKEGNLYRPTNEEAIVGNTLYPSEPEFSLSLVPTKEYRSFIESLGASSALDDLALLCALYRQAVLSFNVATASVLSKEISLASSTVASTIFLSDDALLLFDALIYRRVIGNNWSPDAPKALLESVRLRYPKKSPARSRKLLDRRISIHALLLDRGPDDKHFRPHVALDSEARRRLQRVREVATNRKTSNIAKQASLDWFYGISPKVIGSAMKRFSPFNMTNIDKLDKIFGKSSRPRARARP